MNLEQLVKEAVGKALEDNLEVDIYVFNDKLSVEIYYDGDLLTESNCEHV